MAYNYLLDLYRALGQRQEEIIASCEATSENQEEKHFQQGRLTVNREFLSFLKDNYHHKLPRRLQQE